MSQHKSSRKTNPTFKTLLHQIDMSANTTNRYKAPLSLEFWQVQKDLPGHDTRFSDMCNKILKNFFGSVGLGVGVSGLGFNFALRTLNLAPKTQNLDWIGQQLGTLYRVNRAKMLD
jgi:hypothetical protein